PRRLQRGWGRTGIGDSGGDARERETHRGAQHLNPMAAYPQLESGALSQFPVQKTRRARTVVNLAADGSMIKLADPAAEVTEWLLTYTDLSDEEAAALRAFFKATEGTLNGFTFLDPTGNLLAWSEQLDKASWQTDPLLSLTAEVSDPRGGARAWRLSNSGGA